VALNTESVLTLFKPDMYFSEEGLKLLKSFEGCRLTAYKDAVGVLTIGYGSTGKHVTEGLTITQTEAEKLLRKDVTKFELAVREAVKVSINQNEFDALVCFSFNVGSNAFKSSTLLKLLNTNAERSVVASEFSRWNKADGKVLEGLSKRREAEKRLFLRKVLNPVLSASIVAQQDSWLKREPLDSDDLKPEQKVFVPKGSAHLWTKIELVPGETHYKIFLEADGSNPWWFFPKHFKIINDPKPVEKPTVVLNKLHLPLFYFSQRDNQKDPMRTCFSSSCAMLLKYLKPQAIKTDDDYIKTVFSFGDTVDPAVQLKALRHYGVEAEFRQDGGWSDLDSLLIKNIPIPIGILHKGPVSKPTGTGHWLIVIGRTEDLSKYIVHDPFGDLDLVNGTYLNSQGANLLYSKKNLAPRWMVGGPGDGWYIKTLSF